MSKIIKDSSSLESAITPFIDAANTKHWKNALNIFYLNGSVLEIPEATGIPCLISQKGSTEGIEESIDLLVGKSQTKLLPLIIDIAKLFLPKLYSTKETLPETTENVDEAQKAAALAKIATEMMPELEKLQTMGPKLLLRGAFSISDLIAAAIFKTLTEIRTAQTSCGIKETDYERMIDALSRLDVIEPILQVSICPKCTNYQLTISTCPTTKTTCPKCGENWATQAIYMFKGQLSEIKAKNQDLPLFISSYLRQKTSFNTIFGEIRIYPNAHVETPTNKETAEIDVYIPDFKIGIECKTQTDPTTPMTKDRLGGMTGDIINKHVKKYANTGIENIFIVTNLPQNQAQKLETALKTSTRDQNIDLKTLQVIPGNIETLLQFLDKLANKITKRTTKLLAPDENDIEQIEEIDKTPQ
ncbi:MAG: hypothetical protein QXJ94_02960 [Candidatus Bathyarchaeia archaeon]